MAKFEDLVLLIRSLSGRTVSETTVSGFLYVDSAQKLDLLKDCESDQDNCSLSLVSPDNIKLVSLGVNAQIEISTPRPGFALIRESLDAMLSYPSARIREPLHYLLLDIDYCNSDASEPYVVTCYQHVLEFVMMLKSCAAFLDDNAEVLVFVKEGKFEVPVVYGEKDLHDMELETIKELACSISMGIHRKQCESIMAEAVYDMTARIPIQGRFSYLLTQAKELRDRFDKGYRLYAAGFSYDKIRDEIEAARIEYSGKIHKVFSDIQNQLLGIPVAAVVVATQMKPTAEADGNFWVNVGILIGYIIFTVLMYFLLQNQRQTLKVIGIEINRQKAKLEKEHEALAANFIDIFDSLNSRYKSQLKALYIILGVVILGFVLSALFFYRMNQPVHEWLAPAVNSVFELIRRAVFRANRS